MKIRIKFFAGIADLVRRSELECSPAPNVGTVGGLWDWLRREYPELAQYSGPVLMARNHQFASPGESLADGDEIAFFPPVSGG
jgi:molybdopterin converting factor subunit 1